MYLINLKSMKLEYFEDDRKLVYAILSHRWRDEEVLFDDMQNGTAQTKAGYAKLKHFCDAAAAAKYSYAWCDTCCIDKSSSTELSESINSMFRWYQNAAVCYAYLFDVGTTKVDDSSDFKDSSWFTRGWCLQELLASRSLTFFNRDWKEIGTKEELCQEISKFTNIPHEALCGRSLAEFSVAQRMSWASDRATTRVEDMAYSLLGIFGVSMSLLYGEGERAFIRLQEEIIRRSSDQSIFVHSSKNDRQGLLATSPADFRDSSDIESSSMMVGEPYSFTNMGLSMELLLFPWSMEVYLAHLDCKKRGSDDPVSIFLMLRPQVVQRDGTNATDHAVRIKFKGDAWTDHANVSNLPYIQKRLYLDYEALESAQIEPMRYGFWIRTFEGINNWASQWTMWAVCWNEWDSEKRILEIPDGEHGTAGIVELRTQQVTLPLRLGFTVNFEPIIELDGNPNFDYYNIVPNRIVSVRGPDNFRFRDGKGDPPHPSIKAAVLSDMSWSDESLRRREMGAFVKGRHRDLPIQYGPRGFGKGSFKFTCEKLLVEGIRTWVLDIKWRWGMEGLPESLLNKPRMDIITCDGCNERITNLRFKCSTCPDFDFCSGCIKSAKATHDPRHEFGLFEMPLDLSSVF